MNFEKYYKNKSKQKLLLEKSVLLNDILRVVKVRHNEVMHNATHNTFDAIGMIDIIENCVLPWSKEFIAMCLCVLSQPPLWIDDFLLGLECIDCFESNNPMLLLACKSLKKCLITSNEIQSLWFAFSIMIAYNRLLQCNDVIKVYNDTAKPILLKINEPEIAVAIYYEVVLAYANLRKFEETEEFLVLILEKLQGITDTDIHEVKSKILLNLGLTYLQTGQLSKAKHYCDEAMKHESASNNLNMVFQYHSLNANREARLGRYLLSKCHNELIFAKYFHIMRKIYSPGAVAVLQTLAFAYMEEFNVKEVEEALSLLDELYKKHRSDIISNEGQRVVDHEIRILFVQTKYNICKAIYISSEQERIKKLEEIHSELAKERFNSLPDENSEIKLDSFPLHIAILLKEPPNSNISLDEMNSLGLQINHEIGAMIREIGCQSEGLTEESYKNKSVIFNLKGSIVRCLQKMAERNYFNNDLETASLLMRRSYLCESLVSFFGFRRMEEGPRARTREIDIGELLAPLANIFDEVLAQNMRQKFSSERNSNSIK